ncbi:hypothetical protein [Flexivirga oryzae]|uniref:Uncharacterized protein n=1 Tax=Flexivirga oryzae TaxID=1794944 RepID=A0A839NBU0_9MICO|nr:hypothetical protein [Flexivirga oryzae]MBB2892191.1 hypothetical protein [Flexivirga oryzae]
MKWYTVAEDAIEALTVSRKEAIAAIEALPDADERTANEVLGFILRLTFYAGVSEHARGIGAGTSKMVGGNRTETLMEQAIAAGLLVEAEGAAEATT